MLVGATACALQVTASRHRDPPAAAAAAARTRRALSVTWDAARIAYSRHAIEKAGVGTFRRAVEEGARAGGGGEPGATAAEAARRGELRGQRGEAGRRHGVGVGGGGVGGAARRGGFGVARSGGEGMPSRRCPSRHVHRRPVIRFLARATSPSASSSSARYATCHWNTPAVKYAFSPPKRKFTKGEWKVADCFQHIKNCIFAAFG